MSEISTHSLGVDVVELRRQAVRSWWADGLWDFAMAGFFGLMAIWSYVLMRVMSFPSWSWPWPFITDEPINPMQREIGLWMLGGVVLLAAYSYGAYRVVQAIRSRQLAHVQGEVRHPFWLALEKRVWVSYLILFIIVTALYTGINTLVLGEMRYYSVLFTTAPAVMLFVVGLTYRLKRYQWVAVAGLVLSIGLEWLATTSADYMQGPRNFLDVPAYSGNPAIALLVWFAICIASGSIALTHALRGDHGDQS